MRNFYIFLSGCMLAVSCNQFPDLGPNFKVDYNGRGDIQLMNEKNSVLIDGHILDLGYDSAFIIVKQRPRDSVKACSDLANSLRECERAFRESNLELFWIIEKRTKTLNGPFSRDQYGQKRKELNVSESLSLKSIF